MSKLYLNSDPIYKSVLPSIRNTINYLDKAINCLNTANVPNEFSSKAVSQKNAILEIKKDLTNLEEWLNTGTRQLENLEGNMSQIVSSLPIDDIPIRTKKIG